MKDQVTASIMPRTASARLAARVGICNGVRNPAVHRIVVGKWSRRDHVDAVDAHDFLDQIGFALDVRPPRRDGDVKEIAGAADGETQPAQLRDALFGGHVQTGQPFHLGDWEHHLPRFVASVANDIGLCRFAAARISTRRVASSRPGTMNSGSTPRVRNGSARP